MTSQLPDHQIDCSKVLTEWALAAGRHLQSKQTGYVHLFYGETQQGFHTIPILENTLFALALLRSKMVEQIQEAKVILKGLLVFQNLREEDSYGNFPVYLHSYPFCHDPALGLRLLAPLYWMIKQFGHILGVELKNQLEQAIKALLDHSNKVHQTKPLPFFLALRLAAAQSAFGHLWDRVDLKEEGNLRISQLSENQMEGWYSTSHLSDILTALQMVYSSIVKSPWVNFWRFLEQTWDRQTGTYAGPCIREWQQEKEPQSHLYDLYAGYFSGRFSRRASLLQPYHLQGVLIQPSLDKFTSPQDAQEVEGTLKVQKWVTFYQQNRAVSLLAKNEPCQPVMEKTYTPLRFIWGDLQRVHTLVCQGGSYDKVEFFKDNGAVTLIFDLKDHLQTEDQSPKSEIEFFVDFQSRFTLTLNGFSTSTFELGQNILLKMEDLQFEVCFQLVEGEGQFLGHLMPVNRPSQIEVKGERRFEAYDWSFFLRTIRRNPRCRIRVDFFPSIPNDSSLD